MLDFLDEYTKKHFKDEEAFMVEIRYPELEAQKKAV
jgi:hemerythrin